MVIDWPNDLTTDVARRRCVLVLGAGISANSKNVNGDSPKTWYSFLLDASESVNEAKTAQSVRKMLRAGDLLTACQIVRDHMGPPNFHNLAQSEYLSPGFQHATIHDRIIELDSRIVATPNFDTIYENRVNAIQHSTVAVKNYYDNDIAECIRGTKRVVLKIHGTIHTPNKMIFTREDYARARNQHSRFYEILNALAVTHTFLFMGCGLEDPDIRLLLEDYGFRHEYSRPHYFVIPSNKVDQVAKQSIEKVLNVKFLEYPTKKGDHSKLLAAITELRDNVNQERNQLATFQNW
jgi:hypothetical protein